MQVVVHLAQATSAGVSLAAPEQSQLIRSAYACGTRTLVRGAAACAALTQMPLAVSYVSGEAAFASEPMSGVFTVGGLTFGPGELELKIGPYQILTQVRADGSLGDSRLGPLGTTGTLVVTHG